MIRAFNNKEIEEIMKIWLDSNIEAHDFINESYWTKNYNSVKSKILMAEVYVYETNGDIYGFVGLINNYIAGVFVKKDMRRKGIGKQLIDFLKENHNELYLEVYRKNEEAIKFYLREGFRIIESSIDNETNEEELIVKWQK